MHKLSSLPATNITDPHGNTNIKIKISDSSANLRSKQNNSESQQKVTDQNNNQDVTDIDDVTTPFKNASDLTMTENDPKASKCKSRNKSFFRSIFCCFKSSDNLQKNRNNSKSKNNNNNPSKSSSSSSSKANNNNTETFVNSNQFKDVTSQQQKNNTTNLQNLSIHATTNDKSSRVKKNSDNTNNSGNNSYNTPNNTTGKSSFTNVDSNNNNMGNYNRNSGNVQYTSNNNYTNTDNNNNISMYNQASYFSNGNDNINLNNTEKALLGPIRSGDSGRKCLIIDLDETLVHSSFKQVANADFIVPVEIDGIVHQVYVLKRPHVDEFLQRMGKLFECVLFTASLAKYADPVADLLDKSTVFRDRLFREACVYYRGNYVKDLSKLGRDLTKTIIIDNSPASYIFHPDNAVGCTSWFDDSHDTELLDLIPYFEKLAASDSVYSVLKQSTSNSMNSSLNAQNQINQNFYKQQSIIYSQQQSQQSYDENQQVPSPQLQSLIYQQQQSSNQAETTLPNSPDYTLNENKILLSIDLMVAKKQQQMQ